MIIVNLDEAFETYLKHWMRDNAESYGTNMDKLEEMIPDVYTEFLHTPLESLNGQTPEDYFGSIRDAGELVTLLRSYILSHTPVPDLLLERIVETGKEAEPLLLDLIQNPEQDEEIRMTVKSSPDVISAVQRLVDRANGNGGYDNIGIVLIEPFARD